MRPITFKLREIDEFGGSFDTDFLPVVTGKDFIDLEQMFKEDVERSYSWCADCYDMENLQLSELYGDVVRTIEWYGRFSRISSAGPVVSVFGHLYAEDVSNFDFKENYISERIAKDAFKKVLNS